MLFKEVTELPSPRYALDDDDDNGLAFTTEYDLKVVGKLEDIERLVVVAPRVLGLRGELTRSLTATLSLVVRQTLPQERSLDLEGRDVEIDESSRETIIKVSIHEGPQNTSVLALPLLGEAEAAFLAKALVKRLPMLAEIIVAAPGTMYDSCAVCYISTPNATVPKLANPPAAYGPATPPVIVQGAPAAFLSQAQQRGIPAIGYIVNSDGPLNHEAIQAAHFDVLREVLHGSLALESGRGPDVSTLYV